MNNKFIDIINVIGEPIWYDNLGYPRYCEFHPNLHSNIYARYIALILIQCQYCNQQFKIAEAITDFHILKLIEPGAPGNTTAKDIDRLKYLPQIDRNKVILDIGFFHYGDPPNHGCTGDSMNCESLILLEMWENDYGWKKIPLKKLMKK